MPLPLGFRHPAGERPSHGHRQQAQKIGKDRPCGSGDILADRQTDRRTDVLITILQLQQTVKIFTEHNCYCKTLREMSKNTQNTKKAEAPTENEHDLRHGALDLRA